MKTESEILIERAKLTSGRNKTNNNDQTRQVTIVEFFLSPERYGIEEKYVSEALSLKEITPIPGTPPFVMGVINLRGRIVSIINLKILFNLKERGLTELNKVLILKNEIMEFGIIADSIIGNKLIDTGTLSAPPLTLDHLGLEFISAVDPSGLIFLNAEKILKSKNIVVK